MKTLKFEAKKVFLDGKFVAQYGADLRGYIPDACSPLIPGKEVEFVEEIRCTINSEPVLSTQPKDYLRDLWEEYRSSGYRGFAIESEDARRLKGNTEFSFSEMTATMGSNFNEIRSLTLILSRREKGQIKA